MLKFCRISWAFHNGLSRTLPSRSYWLTREFSSEHRSGMDNLLPPDNVRGMKRLDKSMFHKPVSIPCLVSPEKCVKTVAQLLKVYLLKMQCFKAVQVPNEHIFENMNISTNDIPKKIIYLDPRKVKEFKDFDEDLKEKLQFLGVKQELMFDTTLILSYDNWKSSEILRAVIPEELEGVTGFSQIGHIIHLNLREELLPYKNIIGEVLMDKVPQARTVVNKSDIISTEFRYFNLEVIAGEKELITTVKENGSTFGLDFSMVYWNPRLSTEHERVISQLEPGDVLFDVFAGIGPFSVPSSKKGVMTYANDLNPHAIFWLRKNLTLNKVKEDKIKVSNKDGRDFIKEDFMEAYSSFSPGNYKVVIAMNLPDLATDFITSFLSLFPFEKIGLIRSLPVPTALVYLFIKKSGDPVNDIKKNIKTKLGIDTELDDSEVVREISLVRNVAPNKYMYRASVHLTPDILVSKKRSSEMPPPTIKKSKTMPCF